MDQVISLGKGKLTIHWKPEDQESPSVDIECDGIFSIESDSEVIYTYEIGPIYSYIKQHRFLLTPTTSLKVDSPSFKNLPPVEQIKNNAWRQTMRLALEDETDE